MKLNLKNAISAINKHGILIVFPVNNQKEPHSLWSEFFPQTPMRWEWSDDGDDNVVKMWHLMKELSSQKGVVYSKWYKGRATFFSRDLFTSLLCQSHTHLMAQPQMPRTARAILETLHGNSPLSTRIIKKENDLQGKDNEAEFSRAMKYLFSHLLIVGCGEVDDGAFPSLAVGSTELVFEDLWLASKKQKNKEALFCIDKYMPQKNLTRKFLQTLSTSGHRQRSK